MIRGAGKVLSTPGIRLVIETHGVPLEKAIKEELELKGFNITLVSDYLGGSSMIYAKLPENQ